jgi:hypothetical protein
MCGDIYAHPDIEMQKGVLGLLRIEKKYPRGDLPASNLCVPEKASPLLTRTDKHLRTHDVSNYLNCHV